ncbi:phosphotransferase family protein [Aeromicrobium sp.]|uniref:phosphotransferase family protein n=1 Tax=Aeromicrobium sp. TaxID=1871063 RepID=UPI002FC737BB
MADAVTPDAEAITPDVEAINVTALRNWMVTLGVPVGDRLASRPIGNGRSNLTFELSDDFGRKWVARRPPLGVLLESAHDVAREYRILSALQGTKVPVPSLIGLAVDESIAETPVLVMEHVDGEVFDRRPIATALEPRIRRELGEGLVDTLVHIHEVDLGSVGLDSLASKEPYAARQLRRWSAQLERSRSRSLPELDRLTELLSQRAPSRQATTLVHGDFNLSNVMADRSSGKVVSVLDWELCTLGDPLADMGSLLAYWRHDNEYATGAFAASALPGFPLRDELAARYARSTGCNPGELKFWHVFGLWKLAVIGEGVLSRDPERSRNSSTHRAGVEQIDDLVRRAWVVANHTGLGN